MLRRRRVGRADGSRPETYDDVHRFSVDRLTDFWAMVWEFTGVRHARKYDQVLTNPDARPGELPRFFEGAQLNLAENM